uniref:RRM domain-containing protein n=1 Tax=Amphimedon queenslandica TaxID=400682 RepID=A0A1X7SYH3_AMPQE
MIREIREIYSPRKNSALRYYAQYSHASLTPKRYGFVDFMKEADALNAILSLQAIGIDVQFAIQQEEDPTNLYLANLPKFYSHKDLKNLFGNFGIIISIRILHDSVGYSRGVGFVSDLCGFGAYQKICTHKIIQLPHPSLQAIDNVNHQPQKLKR